MQFCLSGGVCSSLCRDQLLPHQRNFIKFSEENGKTATAFPWPCVYFLVPLALNRCGVYKVIDLVSQSLFACGRLASWGPSSGSSH